ncbi:MAG: hypothetical protein MUD10_03190 [Candidatus Pacebacteria bacterium]|nr:hypothetical protein [Candidatus Paceibacterota bacterium]
MEPIKKVEGSSKNVWINKEPGGADPGEGAFEFTDYFSVFDWGRFLDEAIPGKGEAMAAVVKKYFDLLNQAGVKSHYKGMSGDNLMDVKLVNIPQAHANVAPGIVNYLLPIEIIFRIYTHPESSDLKKIKEGKRTFEELGYEEMPEPNKRLPRTKISYSTKLEETDRVLSKEEARVLAGLTIEEMDKLEGLARKTCDVITDHSEKIGLIHYDGKIEVAKDMIGDFMVVDVLGTLDEDRFMMDAGNGNFVDVSKQFIRNWYKAQGWKKEVDAAKKKAEEAKDEDWKKYCPQPPRMPDNVKKLVAEMYLADAKERGGADIGAKFGLKVRPLIEVAKDIHRIQQSY